MIGPSKSKQIFIFLFLFYSFLFNHASSVLENSDVFQNISFAIKNIIKCYPHLVCGVYIKPSWTSKTININGDATFPAASLIKIPISVLLLKEIDDRKLSWDKVLSIERHHKAKGAGLLKARKIGTKVKLKDLFKLMLIFSDNTATHMIIDLLGGYTSTNNKILKLGLKNTKLIARLDDFSGLNKTSPHDLVDLLDRSLEKNLLKSSSRRYLKKTLLHVNNKALIKKGLPRFTRFAHKTGTIGICVGDAGIIYLPFRRKVTIGIIVRRPFNSLSGQKVIREISKLVYEEMG